MCALKVFEPNLCYHFEESLKRTSQTLAKVCTLSSSLSRWFEGKVFVQAPKEDGVLQRLRSILIVASPMLFSPPTNPEVWLEESPEGMT